uniref:hypothetical protein n=1 Tax=Anaerococcus mediterraneensis TaxID=1870984 RepID=UPI0009317AC5|nr:hypothetical protein [Anaerococcus mediterraneensis]
MEVDNSKLYNYIKSIKEETSNKQLSSLDFILTKARENNCVINESDGNYYIKKSDQAKALFHLNIDNPVKSTFDFEMDDNSKYIKSTVDIHAINASIIIAYLLENLEDPFDIFISTNNSQLDFSDYAFIKKHLRTDNIINLNLRDGDCIVNEFSSLYLAVAKVPIKRFKPDYDYKTYRLSVDKLMGGFSGDNINKVRLNAIKFLTSIFRKMKSKVDLEMIIMSGGDKYDNIPSNAHIDFIIDKKFENELVSIFDIIKNEAIEKNLRYEPDMEIRCQVIDKNKFDPMTSESFNHLASFIELSHVGSFSVNSLDNQAISSSNMASIRTIKNSINLILVFRSLSQESMDQMLEKNRMASNISHSTILKKLFIPKRKNSDQYLTEVFVKTYKDLYSKDLNVIKTQYSLYSSIVFKDLNVKIVSLGVKYKQDDNFFASSISDINKTIYLLENVIENL